MAPTETVLYVHRNRWEFNLAPEMTVWAAHRPLRGEVTWEGPNVGWGRHYATTSNDSPELADHDEHNRCMDARLVSLVDNMEALTLAGEWARRTPGAERYGLGAYVLAYLDPEDGGPREGARTFLQVYGLPWDDADTSADALLAALAAA